MGEDRAQKRLENAEGVEAVTLFARKIVVPSRPLARRAVKRGPLHRVHDGASRGPALWEVGGISAACLFAAAWLLLVLAWTVRLLWQAREGGVL